MDDRTKKGEWKKEMDNGRDGSSRRPVLGGMPRTRLGWGSIGLAILFFVFFLLWLLYLQATPMARPTFFSDPVHAFLILSAAGAAITGAGVGLLAIVAKGDRSFTIFLSVVLGAFVLFWSIAEVIGH